MIPEADLRVATLAEMPVGLGSNDGAKLLPRETLFKSPSFLHHHHLHHHLRCTCPAVVVAHAEISDCV